MIDAPTALPALMPPSASETVVRERIFQSSVVLTRINDIIECPRPTETAASQFNINGIVR